ncbi:hypothetical protein UFOVP713_21 [uncultured Caudovirales phage]|jgi:hypothetical protein|uniref:Uncharacterized protein n=1 Tax=uncultured Caudovirales phage TaxID=2100421 RepID=A0A6J5NHI7_9CAUD|nr:hypothetical protein UFOVP713_21 [uncultured Caudovirales phage]
MNPLNLISQFLALTQEQHDAVIKFCIAVTFCCTVIIMVGISLYSVVFVTQPMNGMAPADKQFFLILSDMSKYILGSLATLLAVKGKDALPMFTPPGLSTDKERSDPAPTKPTPAAPVARTAPVVDAAATTGYGGKPAPVQPPHPERDE